MRLLFSNNAYYERSFVYYLLLNRIKIKNVKICLVKKMLFNVIYIIEFVLEFRTLTSIKRLFIFNGCVFIVLYLISP